MKNSITYLVAPLLGWFVAQGLKYAVNYKSNKLDISDLYISGGMPSSHAATVMALATTITYMNGITSPVAAVSAVVAAIVLYDARGVRRAVGEQGRVIERLEQEQRVPKSHRPFRAEGHTPWQVLIGSIVGVACGLIVIAAIA